MLMTRWCVVLIMLVISWPAAAQPDATGTLLASGERRVALIELFTSEGCSSCPPADRWLSRLAADPDLWQNFVPVGFHVDYWDYIGWKDRFATAAFSERQRKLVGEGGARFVYTPGFFRNGQEWRGWQSAKSVATDTELVGELTAQINGEIVQLHFDPHGKNYRELTAHIAVLGMNVATQVRTGENRGKTLRHDFVTLGLAAVALEKVASGYQATTPLPEIRTGIAEQAVAVWVSEAGSQRPIQSVGGFRPTRVTDVQPAP